MELPLLLVHLPVPVPVQRLLPAQRPPVHRPVPVQRQAQVLAQQQLYRYNKDMADALNQPSTHITDLKGTIRVESAAPTNPVEGDMYFNSSTGYLMRYTSAAWKGAQFTRA